jgi:hypothetical protein
VSADPDDRPGQSGEVAPPGDETGPVRAEIVRPGAGGDPGWPEPTDEEVAAIVAAIEVTRPRPAPPTRRDHAPRWRFSGRWWSKPVPLRRSRPW